MLVMSDTPVVICSYALIDIEARPCQCVKNLIIDKQADSGGPSQLFQCVEKNVRTSLIVSLMRRYSLDNYNRV